jgi:hypothetical protein
MKMAKAMAYGDFRRSFPLLFQITAVISLLFLSPCSLVIAKPLSSVSHPSSLRHTFGHRGLKQQTPPAPAPAPAVTPQVIEEAVDAEQEQDLDIEAEPQDTNDKNDEKDKDEQDDAEKDEEKEDDNDSDKEDEVAEAEKDEDKEDQIVEAQKDEDIGEAEQENDKEDEIVEVEIAESEIVEAETGQVEEGKEEKEDEKYEEDADEGELPIVTFVALPDIVLELGVDRTPDNIAAIETLIEGYMSTLLPVDVMGSNYVSSDLQATMSKTLDEGENGNTLLDFTIQGLAQYQADPVPQTEELKDRLIWFFSRWQGQGLLEAFLEENGIDGTQVTNVYVDSEKVPLATINGATSTASDGQASGGGGSKAGLAVGLSAFFLCMLAAAIVLYYNRQLMFNECRTWSKGGRACCKSTRDKLSKMKLEKAGWINNFDADGSSTVLPEQDRNQRAAAFSKERPKLPKCLAWLQRDKAIAAGGSALVMEEDSSQCVAATFSKEPSKLPKWLARLQRDKTIDAEEDGSQLIAATFSKEPPKLPKWLAWIQRNKATTEAEDPSQVLPNVQVVVDSSRVPRPVVTVSHRISQWDMPKHHSEVTVPRANHKIDEESPQKTVNSYLSDEVSVEEPLDDPIVRYAPPTRCQGRMYKSKSQNQTSPSTVASTPSPRTSRASAPPDPEEPDSCVNTFAEWAASLNPCMLPTIPLFQTESEKLDDLVSNLPHNKSVFCFEDKSAFDDASVEPIRREM